MVLFEPTRGKVVQGFANDPCNAIANGFKLGQYRTSVSRRNRRNDMDKFLNGNNKYAKARSKKSNKQNHSTNTRSFSPSAKLRDIIAERDLHNHGIHQAITRIKQDCRYGDKDVTIMFIHGNNHGTKIRDFIRNGQLKQSLDSTNISGDIWWNREGVTYFNRV